MGISRLLRSLFCRPSLIPDEEGRAAMGIFPLWQNGAVVINGRGTVGRVNGEDARKRRNDTEDEKMKKKGSLVLPNYIKYLQPVQKIFLCTGCQICLALKKNKNATIGRVASSFGLMFTVFLTRCK